MPFTVKPSDAKAIIPSVSGNFCERFLRAITGFPQLFFNFLSEMVTEQGTLTDNFKAMVCDLGCAGGGTGGGGGGTTGWSTPTRPTASDGSLSDTVNITWPVYTPPDGQTVDHYKVYRADGSVTNPSLAAVIATITAPTVSYDDTSVIPGTIYNFWYKAFNLGETQSSPYSPYDAGNASVPTGDIDAVADLRTTYGMGAITSAIALDWTPPAGATKYDIWRGTTNVFADATKIYADVSPAPTTTLSHPDDNPTFWDNVERVVLYDTPPSNATDYYYFVVAKKDSPPAVSDESNDSLARVLPPAIYNQNSEVLEFGSLSYIVPAGITKAWVVLRGSGGGGAGGGEVYGGAGGGGGGTVRFTLTVAELDELELDALTGVDTGNAASETNGADGEVITLTNNTVLVGEANPGTGGNYNPGGAGDGGEGGDAGAPAGSPVVYNGADGMPSNGANGGRSGYLFGGRRMPMADAVGIYNGDGFVGSGAKAIAFNPPISIGGYALTGKAYITFGT